MRSLILKPEGKARIIDIALQAGVSTATVDRVLNKRPGVRQKTIDRVIEAVKWLEKGPKRPAVIPTITSDLTVDMNIAAGAGFANDVLVREIKRNSNERGGTVRWAHPRRMDPAALASALRTCQKAGSSGASVVRFDASNASVDAITRFAASDWPVRIAARIDSLHLQRRKFASEKQGHDRSRCYYSAGRGAIIRHRGASSMVEGIVG